MKSRTGGELIQDFLKTYDIPFVFGNPGTTETTFLAAVAASKATYVLCLHESTAVGIAAGYALITGKPSVVSLHTYPGLANGMFNMRNALMSGVPLLVINGQQDSRFLIHNPVLGAPNTRLAETATKYAYEVTRADDLAVALQRIAEGFGARTAKIDSLQAVGDVLARALPHKGPSFLIVDREP